MEQKKPPGSPLTAIIVIAISIAAILLIYHFTVGSKVSRQAAEDEGVGVSGEATGPGGIQPTTGPGASHAVEVDDEEAVTRPGSDKRPLPPSSQQQTQ